jgi:hypothetical protein
MIALPRLGPTANDNRVAYDVTALTMMAFGPSLIGALVVSALYLVKVW